MKCAVITPIGPGHEKLSQDTLGSIYQASAYSQGPFDIVASIRVPDYEGEIGRSQARNWAVEQAHEAGFEWVFFLDADDVMVPQAFESMTPHIDKDAVWGKIFDVSPGEEKALPREQVEVHSLEDLLSHDPYLTLQMGHFVKTEVALENPFNVDMDSGEDFDYYVRIWKKYDCDKIDHVFFVNRRGLHSTGPRSAHGGIWRKNVELIIKKNRIIH